MFCSGQSKRLQALAVLTSAAQIVEKSIPVISDSERGFEIGMAAKKAIKRSDALTDLARQVRQFVKRQKYARKWDDATHTYLATHQVKKLEIGARVASLKGWLSTDVDPVSADTVFLDATKPFPFDCGTFDYIYCEHMIEHISWQNGQTMLCECNRVLKPGGVMRIATPDLAVILGLYSTTLSEEQKHYIDWMVRRELPEVSTHKAAFVINNTFRNWGHQFVYDGNLMTLALERCGFTDIRRCAYGESNDEHLRGIEMHGMHIGDEKSARFESMIFEGTRPA
jgi:predicted SAM-dependent methyltransferase